MRKRLSKRFPVLLFCFAAGCFVTGCKKSDNPPKPPQALPAANQKVAAKPNVAAKPDIAVQKPISTAKAAGQAASPYNFKAKKDPFKPLITPPELTAKTTKAKVAGALPIQSYETEKFIVTGIITGLKENSALIIDPLGKGYVVKLGMLIGDGGGRVTNITASSVEVTERYTDEKKQTRTRKIVLPLARKNKESHR